MQCWQEDVGRKKRKTIGGKKQMWPKADGGIGSRRREGGGVQ